MRKYCIIIIMCFMLVLTNSCTVDLPEVGISNVDVTGFDIVDSCTYRYYISFDDQTENISGQYFWYWVGLQKLNAGNLDPIIVFSSGDNLAPPFSNHTMSVDLSSNNNVSPQDLLFATAQKTYSSLNIGDVFASFGSDMSEGPVDFTGFPPTCCPFAIYVDTSGVDINEGECIYINTTPSIPDINARIGSGQISGTVYWALIISYTRSGRDDSDTMIAIVDANSTWDINPYLGTMIRGGQAILSCYSVELDCTN